MSRVTSRRRPCRHAGYRHFRPAVERLETRIAPALALQSDYGNRPMVFEPNLGQTDPQARFLSRGPGYALFLTANDAVLRLQRPPAENGGNDAAALTPPAVLDIRLVNADPSPAVP